MSFSKFAKVVRNNFDEMSKKPLYIVECDKYELFDLYINSFPEGSNPIYKERTEHDCNCCKGFIRNVGNVVSIENGKLRSIWDLKDFADDGIYYPVAKALAEKVRALPIRGVFKHFERKVGALTTHQQLESGGVKTWNHFQCDIPRAHYNPDRASELSGINSTVQVYRRGLTEITDESVNSVLDLINSNSIYRGEEFKASVTEFKKNKSNYDKASNKDIFVWDTYGSRSATIRNTVIGTLLTDLSDGKDLESSVASYEAKVAPQNYKRTSSLITQRMVDDAMKTVDELEIRDALPRRYAKIDDVSVNNVLFVDNSVQSKMKDSIATLLASEVKPAKVSNKNAEAISIDDFIANIIPKTSGIKMFVEGKHKSNMVSLITPEDKDAKSILQWNNNFSWSYNGDVTDSIKEKVKRAGGSVTGIIRTSLSWFNKDDLDLQVVEPNGRMINFSRYSSPTSGRLDVDMNVGNPVRDAVENITWENRSRILNGNYQVRVNNYHKRESIDVGFTIEVECNGEVHTFSYNKAVRNKDTITVVDFSFDGVKVDIKKCGTGITTSSISQDIWNINTEKFIDVDTIMYSPNHWDGQSVGNKHYIFALKDCKNPDETRGLYNEFLRNDLTKHRKVLEILGSKMKCAYQDEQLSGLGFSSTRKDSVICRVEGEINKTYEVKF